MAISEASNGYNLCLNEYIITTLEVKTQGNRTQNTADASIKISMYFVYVKKLSRNLIQEVAHAVLWLLYELVASRHV